ARRGRSRDWVRNRCRRRPRPSGARVRGRAARGSGLQGPAAGDPKPGGRDSERSRRVVAESPSAVRYQALAAPVPTEGTAPKVRGGFLFPIVKPRSRGESTQFPWQIGRSGHSMTGQVGSVHRGFVGRLLMKLVSSLLLVLALFLTAAHRGRADDE